MAEIKNLSISIDRKKPYEVFKVRFSAILNGGCTISSDLFIKLDYGIFPKIGNHNNVINGRKQILIDEHLYGEIASLVYNKSIEKINQKVKVNGGMDSNTPDKWIGKFLRYIKKNYIKDNEELGIEVVEV